MADWAFVVTLLLLWYTRIERPTPTLNTNDDTTIVLLNVQQGALYTAVHYSPIIVLLLYQVLCNYYSNTYLVRDEELCKHGAKSLTLYSK